MTPLRKLHHHHQQLSRAHHARQGVSLRSLANIVTAKSFARGAGINGTGKFLPAENPCGACVCGALSYCDCLASISEPSARPSTRAVSARQISMAAKCRGSDFRSAPSNSAISTSPSNVRASRKVSKRITSIGSPSRVASRTPHYPLGFSPSAVSTELAAGLGGGKLDLANRGSNLPPHFPHGTQTGGTSARNSVVLRLWSAFSCCSKLNPNRLRLPSKATDVPVRARTKMSVENSVRFARSYGPSRRNPTSSLPCSQGSIRAPRAAGWPASTTICLGASWPLSSARCSNQSRSESRGLHPSDMAKVQVDPASRVVVALSAGSNETGIPAAAGAAIAVPRTFSRGGVEGRARTPAIRFLRGVRKGAIEAGTMVANALADEATAGIKSGPRESTHPISQGSAG